MIRRATQEDAAALAALHKTCFGPRGERVWTGAEWETFLGNPATLCLLDAADTITAALLIQTASDEADIVTIMTDPTHQRSGSAYALLAHACNQLRLAGCARLVLEVAADNLPARAFYEKSGFAQIGTRPGYYKRTGANPVDALIMARAI